MIDSFWLNFFEKRVRMKTLEKTMSKEALKQIEDGAREEQEKRLQTSKERTDFADAAKKISPELKNQCEQLVNLLDEKDREYAKKHMGGKDENQLKEYVKKWLPATTGKRDAIAFAQKSGAEGALKAVDKIWKDKNIPPEAKKRQFEAVLVGLKMHERAQEAIRDARLAPSRKKGLQQALSDLWQFHKPEDIEKAIKDEILGAIQEGKDTEGEIKKKRGELNKVLEGTEGGIPLFSEGEQKALKAKWSKEIFGLFFSGREPIKHTKDWVFAQIKAEKEKLQKELGGRKETAREFAGIRKVFEGLTDKKADKGNQESGPVFGKWLSAKRFEGASQSQRQNILFQIMSIAKGSAFQDVYGKRQKAGGMNAISAFIDTMRIGQFVKNQEKKFAAEMKIDEQKGLALKDWSDAHRHFGRKLPMLKSFASSDLVDSEIAKREAHLATCESEIMKDVLAWEKQDELAPEAQAKIAHWYKNSGGLKNELLRQRIKNLAADAKDQAKGAEGEEGGSAAKEKGDVVSFLTEAQKGSAKITNLVTALAALNAEELNRKAQGKEAKNETLTMKEMAEAEVKQTIKTESAAKIDDQKAQKAAKVILQPQEASTASDRRQDPLAQTPTPANSEQIAIQEKPAKSPVAQQEAGPTVEEKALKKAEEAKDAYRKAETKTDAIVQTGEGANKKIIVDTAAEKLKIQQDASSVRETREAIINHREVEVVDTDRTFNTEKKRAHLQEEIVRSASASPKEGPTREAFLLFFDQLRKNSSAQKELLRAA